MLFIVFSWQLEEPLGASTGKTPETAPDARKTSAAGIQLGNMKAVNSPGPDCHWQKMRTVWQSWPSGPRFPPPFLGHSHGSARPRAARSPQISTTSAATPPDQCHTLWVNPKKARESQIGCFHLRSGQNTLLGPSTFLNVIVFGGDLIVLQCFRTLAVPARKSPLCSTSLVREVHFRISSSKIATL